MKKRYDPLREVTEGHRATNLIPPHVSPFHVVDEGFIYNPVSTGCRIITGKIPVAGIRWAGLVKRFDGLKWWEEHIHPADRDRVVLKVRNHIENGIESWQDEYRFISADGTVKNVYDRGFILLDNDHKPYRMIGAMMDITERKKQQHDIRPLVPGNINSFLTISYFRYYLEIFVSSQ